MQKNFPSETKEEGNQIATDESKFQSEPTTPVSGTPRSDAGSAIAHGPFAAEVDKVPCPVRETFDWTDVRGVSKQPIRPPVEQNWHTDVTRAHPNPVEPAARCVCFRTK